jgi:prepilin-type N-terminal cleavage/methylation domain-containing protein
MRETMTTPTSTSRTRRLPRAASARAGERGMTLVEMLVSISLLVVAVAAVAMFSMAHLRRSLAFAESSELNDRRAALSSLLRADFDRAGAGLTRVKEPGAGMEAISFPDGSDYTMAQDTFTRTSGSYAEYVISGRGIGSGGGILTVAPDSTCYQCMAGLVKSAQSGAFDSNNAHYFYFLTGAIVIWDAGQPIASTDYGYGAVIPAHQDGDTYSVQIEPGDSSMVVAYYRNRAGTKSLLARGTQPMTSYPALPFVSTCAGGQILRGLTVTGAPIVDATSAPTQVALLPTEDGSRLPGVIYARPGTQCVVVFGGDADTDVMTTKGNWQDAGNGGGLPLTPPSRGQLSAGDYVMLVDFAQQKSVLYQVTANDLDRTGLLEVVPASSGAPAWGHYYSLPDDYQSSPVSGRSIVFPEGSTVVKLAPPVEWFVADGAVLRREIGSAATVADLAVRNPGFSESLNAGMHVYQLDLTLVSEGVESVSDPSLAATTPLSLAITPRALNLTFNNQTP